MRNTNSVSLCKTFLYDTFTAWKCFDSVSELSRGMNCYQSRFGTLSPYKKNHRFGPRLTCIAGSLISSLAIFLSSYATGLTSLMIRLDTSHSLHIRYLSIYRTVKKKTFFSYGLFGGLGLGLMYLPSVVAVGQYFNSRLSLATGTAFKYFLPVTQYFNSRLSLATGTAFKYFL